MEVSIIICTRNRAQRLGETLRAIHQSGALDANSELLVIDNGSTDSTASVFSEMCADPTRARYFLEPRNGKGFACATALAEAHGQVLLFTDDDLSPPPGWVQTMSRPILDGVADAVQGGVFITPSLLRPWMERRHREMLASTEFLNPAAPEGLLGANMAIGRHVFDRIPAFDVELGPGKLGSCEETLLFQQMREAGFHIAGALDCRMEHFPDATRLSPIAWINQAERQGRSEAYVQHHWSHETASKVTLRHRLGQCYWAAKRFARFIRRRHPSEAELNFVTAHTRASALARLRGSPRNYDKFGLVKIRGLMATDARCQPTLETKGHQSDENPFPASR